MQATMDFPEAVLQQLETLARSEGTTVADLIQRIVQTHIANYQVLDDPCSTVSWPIIPAAETGPIQPVSGRDVDELFLHDHFAA